MSFTEKEIKAVKEMGWPEQYCVLCCEEKDKSIKVVNFICENCSSLLGEIDKEIKNFMGGRSSHGSSE